VNRQRALYSKHALMLPIDLLMLLFALALDIWLAAIIFRQKQHKQFPFFFAYVFSCILIMIARLSVISNYTYYFYVYWATEPIYAVLILLALNEAFHDVFLAFYKFWWFWLVFPGVVAAIAGFVVAEAVQHPPAEAPLLLAVILSFAKSVNYVEAGLFGLFFLLMWLLGLRWQSHIFGIVMGFAALALGEGYSVAARSAFGTKFNTLAKYGRPVAYILAVVIWLVAFLSPAQEQITQEETNTVQPEQLLAEVRQYVQVLKGLFGKHQ